MRRPAAVESMRRKLPPVEVSGVGGWTYRVDRDGIHATKGGYSRSFPVELLHQAGGYGTDANAARAIVRELAGGTEGRAVADILGMGYEELKKLEFTPMPRRREKSAFSERQDLHEGALDNEDPSLDLAGGGRVSPSFGTFEAMKGPTDPKPIERPPSQETETVAVHQEDAEAVAIETDAAMDEWLKEMRASHLGPTGRKPQRHEWVTRDRR